MTLRNITMIGVHGLWGGEAGKTGANRPQGFMGYSTGIDTMFVKADRLAPGKIKYVITEQYEDPVTYAYFEQAMKRGDIIVGAGHSLGVPDIVNAAMRLFKEHGYVTNFILGIDGTWNAPSPAINNGIRRMVNYYGTGFSLLGHDQIETAEDYSGVLANIGIRKGHTAIDDDLGVHATFLREVQWLLDPHDGSATLPESVRPERISKPELDQVIPYRQGPEPFGGG